MIESANTSHLDKKLSACLLRGHKRVGDIYVNCCRNYLRGINCASAHAESLAILARYGRHLQRDRNGYWYLERKDRY
jgi:hypothetical protein